jgi:hypothetical protein
VPMDGGGFRWLDAPNAAADGCAYIVDDDNAIRRLRPRTFCGASRRPDSSYCPSHHALCHIAGGSPGERRRSRETELLAAAVGGKRGRPERIPPERFLQWLEQITRAFARPDCSRIVPRRQV